tara:strand:- start:786 stop:1223 length:438 start_codon:yes stop_codon:yes gene_type:complete
MSETIANPIRIGVEGLSNAVKQVQFQEAWVDVKEDGKKVYNPNKIKLTFAGALSESDLASTKLLKNGGLDSVTLRNLDAKVNGDNSKTEIIPNAFYTLQKSKKTNQRVYAITADKAGASLEKPFTVASLVYVKPRETYFVDEGDI